MFTRITFCCVVLLCGASAHAESKSVTVSGARPVAKAVEQLEAIYGVAITYEDPVYVHNSEIRDVTAQVRRDGKSFPKVLVPMGGTFSFTYEEPDMVTTPEAASISPQPLLKEKALDGIMNALHGFAALHNNAEMFKVVQDNGLFHVTPALFVNPSGQLEQIHAALDTPVSIAPGKRTVYDFLTEMFQSLSAASGYRVGFGTIPLNLFMQHMTTISAADEPARSVLSRLLTEISTTSVPYSWELLYGPGPGDNSYALNIQPFIPKNKTNSQNIEGKPTAN